MQLTSDHHLSFCLNVFQLDTLDKIFAVIANECHVIKQEQSPNKSMGLGMWLSASVVDELKDPAKMNMLKLALNSGGFYVYTLNIFPYGNFHESPVKDQVYYPDWGDSKRLKYTCAAAEILSQLCPNDFGTMSTVPITYGKELPSEAINNIEECSKFLKNLKDKTGVKIQLAFEPEPDCYLETTNEAIDFFKLLRSKLKPELIEYLGVCLDTCHSALQFESPKENLKKYIDADVSISKVQISAAPILRCAQKSDLEVLKPFSEPIYLHQTRVRNEIGQIQSFSDLPNALEMSPMGEWRCHFHIPLHFIGDENMSSTNLDLDKAFFNEAMKICRHFETETYTYFVLPDPKEDVTLSISKELDWVKSYLK